MNPSFIDNYRAKHQHPWNRATHYVGIPMILVSLVYVFFSWKIGLALFILGWAFQFLGHLIEGNQPAFFKNPIYLLIGPLFVLKKAATALRSIFTPRSAP